MNAIGSVMTGAHVARVGRKLCLGGATLGAVGLLGWVAGARLLTTVVPGQPPMMPNTALALLLVGIAGALRHREDAGRMLRTLSVLAVLIVLAIGGGTLAEYALGADLHIDQLLFRGGAAPYPGRPSPPTALALALLGAALLFFDVRATARVRPSEWLILSAILTAFAALVGFALGAAPFYRLSGAPLVGVAVPTAVSLLLTSVGMLLERPAAGIMRVATSPSPGGMQLRRWALPTVVTPVLLGFVVTRFAEAQGIEIVVAVLAATMTVLGLLVLGVTAVPLNRMHEALESSRTWIRNLVEQAPDGVFLADLDGRYTDVNEAGCDMLGYTREEIVGKTIIDLLPPGDVGRLWQEKENLIGGGIRLSEWTLRCKDGSHVPVEVSSRILPDGRWQAFVRDITERKQHEEALRLAEARAAGILSISADAIISIDEDQRITLLSDGAEKIFGYAKAEVIGQPLDMLLPNRFHEVHRLHVEGFAAGHKAARRMGEQGATIVGVRKNGQEFPADAAISKLNVGGRGILTVALRDITEQKRVEDEHRFLSEVGPLLAATTLDLDETLTRIARIAVLDLADVCIVDLIDQDGMDRRLKVVSRDASMARLCDVLQQIPMDRERPNLIRTTLETKGPILMRRPSPEDIEALSQTDDHLRALKAIDLQSVMVVPLLAHGKLLGSIVLMSVTPSRVYEPADMRVAQELANRAALAIENARLYRTAQRAIQMRDEVLRIVAHDLRGPLSVIVIEAGLLRRRGPEPERRSATSAEAIKSAAARMNRLIQDFLDVARMEAGRLHVEACRTQAVQIASHAVESQRPLASAASLDLQLDLAQDLPDVWADRDRLLQVFENLIGNAVKFTESGRITVGAAAQNAEVLFWVADTGSGIAVEDQPHLFDQFWQARTDHRHHGVGLGLPIVKGIVQAHGGRVWVESALGRGSTFFFTIPTATRGEAERPEPAVHGV